MIRSDRTLNGRPVPVAFADIGTATIPELAKAADPIVDFKKRRRETDIGNTDLKKLNQANPTIELSLGKSGNPTITRIRLQLDVCAGSAAGWTVRISAIVCCRDGKTTNCGEISAHAPDSYQAPLTGPIQTAEMLLREVTEYRVPDHHRETALHPTGIRTESSDCRNTESGKPVDVCRLPTREPAMLFRQTRYARVKVECRVRARV